MKNNMTMTSPSALLAFQEPLAPEEAMKLFDWLADMKDISFNYPENGCFERMNIMTRRLKEKGVTVDYKAWVFSDAFMKPKMIVELEGKAVKWSYHVAPTIPLRTGLVEDQMVLDPGLFDGPVTREEWVSVIAGKDSSTILPYDVSPPGQYAPYNLPSGKDTDNEVDRAMRKHLEYCWPPRLREVFSSAMRKSIANLPTEGKTWKTVPKKAAPG